MEARAGGVYGIPREEMRGRQQVATLVEIGTHLTSAEGGELVQEVALHGDDEGELPISHGHSRVDGLIA